ncbi:MAG: hypothetical protein HQL32_07545 [Planctomycetes bacterium]|nr:hypothetical protein [Planctomycetota bacterium]
MLDSPLLITAMVVGITHTLMGPDHYLPFVALSKARRWNTTRTLVMTFLCGLGHVLSSIIIGAIGLSFGWGLGTLEFIESTRGEIAAWLLTVFGGLYLAWAIKNRGKKHVHTHPHAHEGEVHNHLHDHNEDHAHPHLEGKKRSITAWSLFIIFIFGPCEAFIPVLLFPAIKHDWGLVISVTVIFAAATIATMMSAVYLLSRGLPILQFNGVRRYGHMVAGGIIFSCGMAIHLGL